jgi:hypothetical protein
VDSGLGTFRGGAAAQWAPMQGRKDKDGDQLGACSVIVGVVWSGVRVY